MLQKFADAQVDCFRDSCSTGLPTVSANETTLQIALQLAFGVIGAITVIIVMFGAFKFVTANGNPQEAANARKTILFALIGLAVCVSAELIVTFVLKGL